MRPGVPRVRVRATALAVLILGPGTPAVAQTPASAADLHVEFTQVPRLTQALPVTVRTTGPASYRAVAEIRVGKRKTGEDVVRGRSQARGTLIGFRVPRSARARALQEAARSRRTPVVVVTVTAVLDGRQGTAQRTIERRLRRAPFYDGPLRAPDAPRSATSRFAISWDLPFEFAQVYGAMAGTPSPGTYRKHVAARAQGPRCSVTLHGSATTARGPGRLRGQPVRHRGTRGPWRYERGATQVILSRRAPAALPGARPWLVARFGVALLGADGACDGEVDRTGLAVLRRAIGTVTIRHAPLQLGPGVETA